MPNSDTDEFESADEDLGDQSNQTRLDGRVKVSDANKLGSDVEHTHADRDELRTKIPVSPKTTETSKDVKDEVTLSGSTLPVVQREPLANIAKPIEEGWDDFDDDWNDFDIEQEKRNTNLNEDTQKDKHRATSFKDVDIDEVESKLKDFMKRQDEKPVTTVLDKLSDSGGEKSAASWSDWTPSWGGAVSFLSSASKSVASITTNITQVIESGIGVPTAEELAKRQAEEQAKLKADGYVKEDSDPIRQEQQTLDRFGFDQIVSGVTNISNRVITGGLDTLEGIGKKTMTILQENDPGLLSKRKLLGMGNGGFVLSQVLREAKEKTEERERNLKQVQKHLYKKKLHFETLFDDYHGLVHLEALEMLSKQASLRLESLLAPLTGKALEDLQETMDEVRELCELPDSENDDADGAYTVDELDKKLKEAVVDLEEIKIDFKDLLQCWRTNVEWLSNKTDTRNSQQFFEKAMHALAQTTALCVLRMHKLAENLLILEHHSTANEADALVQLTTVFCWHLSGVAARFSAELSNLTSDEQAQPTSAEDNDNSLITNIFLEGSNSTSYIQNAFQLFIPILQIGAA